jgi:cytochrome c oxidase assembly protein subunit 11
MNEPHDKTREIARAEGAALARRHARVALACAAFVAGMVGMSFAAVPLYDLFCRTTGFGGTPRVAKSAPAVPGERRIVVRFDSNVAVGLPWTFAPERREIEVKVGESALAHYVATSTAPSETAGTATYNVSPPQAGAYFNKLECFCFTEQRLTAGERIEVPVAFFIDPAIERDSELKSLHSITLSYTFFPVKKAPEPLAATGNARVPM